MNALAQNGVAAAIRGIEEARTEAAAMAMGNWGRGYLVGLCCANAITDADEIEARALINAAQTKVIEQMAAIRRDYARAVI